MHPTLCCSNNTWQVVVVLLTVVWACAQPVLAQPLDLQTLLLLRRSDSSLSCTQHVLLEAASAPGSMWFWLCCASALSVDRLVPLPKTCKGVMC